MQLFGPDYGAASAHIKELMDEREDFVQASVAQAARIAELEAKVAALTDDLHTTHQQLSVQTLIAESRARQIDECAAREEQTHLKITKLRSGVRVLWGLFQEEQMRLREQTASVKAGNELLESLSELLSEEHSAAQTSTGPAK